MQKQKYLAEKYGHLKKPLNNLRYKVVEKSVSNRLQTYK